MWGYTREALDGRYGIGPPIQIIQQPFTPAALHAVIEELLAARRS